MSRQSLHPERLDEKTVSLCVVIAFLVGALWLWMLVVLSHPPGERSRLLGLDVQLGRIEALHTSAPARPYGKGVLCKGSAETEALRLKADLQAFAHQAAAPLAQATAAPGLAEVDMGVRPVQFGLEMNGTYPTAIALLRSLASYTPSVLIDRADITDKTGYVHLHLAGRALCQL